jgi:hypothetical protein
MAEGMMAKLEEGLTHCNPEAAVSAPVLKSRLLALRARTCAEDVLLLVDLWQR